MSLTHFTPKSSSGMTSALCLVLFLGCPPAATALDIMVIGSWNKSLDKNDLVAGAGSDLQDTHDSASSQVTVDVFGTTGMGDNWRLDVNLTGNTCNPLLELLVRRTSSGTGGSVNGGLVFQEITPADTPLFNGSGDVSGIGIQLRITGATVQIPASSCDSSVYYTVVDTL